MKNKTETNHTPGPWHIGGHNGGDLIMATGDDEGVLATVYGTTQNEYAANARLIAAAPELLAALEMAHGVIYEALNRRGGKLALSHALNDLCNVLEKAKGTP